MKEETIKKMLANNPWIFGDCELADIKGEKGIGREVNISGLKIDLLLIEQPQKRPVVIEVKTKEFKKEHIGQILIYRSLLTTTTDPKFENEFGNQKLVPRLILVVDDIKEREKIACNLAGIEVRTFDVDPKEIPQNIDAELKRLKDVIEDGKPPLSVREDWVSQIYSIIQDICKEINSKINNDKLEFVKAKFSKETAVPSDIDRLFINAWINLKNDGLRFCDFYEMNYEEGNPYSSKYIYSTAFFRYKKDAVEEFYKECNKVQDNLNLKVIARRKKIDQWVEFKIPRKEIKSTLRKYIGQLVKIHNKIIES